MPARRTAAALASALAATALLAACGGDAEEGAADGGTASATTAEVTIERSRFEPDELTVAPGTEVTWTNLDRATHTVTSTEGSALSFDSGHLGQDGEFTQAFEGPGTYDYFCEVHPTMRSTVVVE